MNKQKLIYQLFIGKVADIIGIDKTTELLKESQEAFKDLTPPVALDEGGEKEQLVLSLKKLLSGIKGGEIHLGYIKGNDYELCEWTAEELVSDIILIDKESKRDQETSTLPPQP